MKKRRNITSYIVIAMILGIAVGYGCHSAFPDPAIAKEIAGYVSLLSDVFLRLIKMIIAPLVFATLTVGIAHMGDTGAVGRVGVKALGWFFIASFTSLLLGLLAATLLQPGSHLSLPLPATDAAVNLKTSAFTLKDFVIHLVPKSIAEAMANNEILQIVVFSIFFGTALSALGDAGKRLTGVIEDLAQVMLKVTGAVMWFAPSRCSRRSPRRSRRKDSASCSRSRSSWAASTSRSRCCGACSRSRGSCSSASARSR